MSNKNTAEFKSGNKNTDEENCQKKEFLGNVDFDLAHGTDSGFLSGPQNSSFQEHEESKQSSAENIGNNFNTHHPNIDKSVHRERISANIGEHCEKAAEELCVVDSGCIEEEECGSNDLHAETEAHAIVQPNTRSRTHVNQTSTSEVTSSKDNKIKTKQDVDAHISERFSNLNLQQGTINDLGASCKDSTVDPEQTKPIKSSAELDKLPAWEQYYQQNDEGDTYLHLACISGYDNVVAALFRLAIHPCLLDIKNDYGQTPLHLAALTKQRKIMRMLLLAGAKPTIRDNNGNTALHIACMSGDEQCVNALTVPFSASEINEAHRQFGYRSNDKRVSSLSYASLPTGLEIRNYNGEYCVHLAAEGGHLQILKTLVQSGADINAREGKGGYTPLHISIEKGNEELFNFLLDDCKPNLETTTFGRLTAYQLTCILKRSQMQSSLEKYGAEPLSPPESEYESSDDESDFEESKNYERFVEPGYFGGNVMAVM
uniref:NF-kappa-B inhibitor cactus n=1 Tax=Bactrocera dorsalis TaxID=27457 RepID=A0A034WPM5_BACDO